MAYLSLEALGLFLHFDRRQDGDRLRMRYQDLAWSVARAGTVVGRVDLGFDYYERIATYAASGVFDEDASLTGVQPETRAGTYNGVVWDLAKGIFLRGIQDPRPSDPGYAEALAYYEERAYGDGFSWDWMDRSEDRVAYRGLIRSSDEAFRSATVLAGVVVANHVVSALDGFISGRTGAASNLGFLATPRSGWVGTWDGTWDVSLRVRH